MKMVLRLLPYCLALIPLLPATVQSAPCKFLGTERACDYVPPPRGCSATEWWMKPYPAERQIVIHSRNPKEDVRINGDIMACDDWYPQWFIIRPRDKKGKIPKGSRAEIKSWVPTIEDCKRTMQLFKREANDSSREPNDKYAKLECAAYFLDQESGE